MGLYVEGHSIQEIDDIHYVMVNIQRNVWGNKLKCHIDVGETLNSENVITDSSGAQIVFRSQVDVMNYMRTVGWKYVETTVTSNPSTGAKIFCLLFVRY